MKMGLHVFKEKGRIADLRSIVDEDVIAHIGIGHTRWATHGVPSKGMHIRIKVHQVALHLFITASLKTMSF